MPLPMSRHAVRQEGAATTSLTYGGYFQAIENFLRHQGMEIIAKTAERLLNHRVDCNHIHRIDVHLIKHGAIYHPSKLVAGLEGTDLPMILNVAASTEGQSILPNEYRYIKRLSGIYANQRLIDVYGWGKGETQCPFDELVMFLGQWLEGYFEFHMTKGENGTGQWQVWNTDQGFRDLTPPQVSEVFQQAAAILAAFYHPLTFEAILDWHHAAGDFIIHPTATGVDTRLITVRRYEPLVKWDDPQPPSIHDVLQTLALFILRTSLFLRLDRLDGVGEHAWADAAVLPAIIEGLSNGLIISADRNGLPQTVIEAAWAFLSAHSKPELLQLGMKIIDKRIAGLTEKAFITERLEAHIDELRNIL